MVLPPLLGLPALYAGGNTRKSLCDSRRKLRNAFKAAHFAFVLPSIFALVKTCRGLARKRKKVASSCYGTYLMATKTFLFAGGTSAAPHQKIPLLRCRDGHIVDARH